MIKEDYGVHQPRTDLTSKEVWFRQQNCNVDSHILLHTYFLYKTLQRHKAPSALKCRIYRNPLEVDVLP